MARVLFGVLAALMVIAYPAAIYLGLSRFSVRVIGPVLIVIVLAGLMIRLKRNQHLRAVLPAPLSVIILVLLGIVLNDHRYMLAMPVLVSVSLLVTFGGTLREPISMVERFARMQNPELPASHAVYCREVTKVWCGFFVLNALIAAFLAVRSPIEWWTAYTGLIAYVLMGMLGAAEYIFRKYRFRDYGKGVHDRLLRQVFPPHE